MHSIKKKYITDKDQKKIAVQISIDDFNKIEEIIEDYALGKLIEANNADENLSVSEAKAEYKKTHKN